MHSCVGVCDSGEVRSCGSELLFGVATYSRLRDGNMWGELFAIKKMFVNILSGSVYVWYCSLSESGLCFFGKCDQSAFL